MWGHIAILGTNSTRTISAAYAVPLQRCRVREDDQTASPHPRYGGTYDRAARTALDEPRVRAMLGALGEELEADPRTLKRLRNSLNPLSTFDFGLLRDLPAAKKWQAR